MRGSLDSSTGAAAKNRLPYGWSAITSSAGSWAGGSVSMSCPPGSSSQRLTVTWFDWRTTCKITDKPTPASAAYCNGMSMVSAKVVTSTAFCTVPVFHTD